MSQRRLIEGIRRFEYIEYSELAAHEAMCCFDIRAHLIQTFVALADVGLALARIPNVVTWAPTRWPAFWCDLRDANASNYAGDCGTHAYIASQVLDFFEIQYVRGRIAIEVSDHLLAHWRATWAESRADERWIGDGIVHHEVLRISGEWWDPSEACWFGGPGAWLDCGLVVAVQEERGEWDFADIKY